MVNGVAKLVIDLGNSSTRVMTKFGNTGKGNPRSRIDVVRNGFARMGLEDEDFSELLSNTAYNDENSRVFAMNGQIFCNGDICDKEFKSYVVRPTANKAKYLTQETKRAIINSFCTGYEAVAEFTKSDVESIDVEWDVTLLLPADNIAKGGKALADMVRSIKELNFIIPEMKKEIKVNSVKIFPEGFAAFIAILYEKVGKIRKGYEYLVKRGNSTLVIDIGAGTTDFLIVEDGNVVTRSKFTVNIGGNNVHQNVANRVKDKYGSTLLDDAARAATETGVAVTGAKEYSIVREVNNAKYDVSRTLINAVIKFFESQSIPMDSINNVLICGGGAEESVDKNIVSLSQYIFETIQESSPEVRLVELPKIDDNGEERFMSPRMLNIIGAGILAD